MNAKKKMNVALPVDKCIRNKSLMTLARSCSNKAFWQVQIIKVI